MKILLILTLSVLTCLPIFSQEIQAPSPIIFIYDASGSMWGQMEGMTKMSIASDVLSTTVDLLPANQPVGLVAYGHREKDNCEDVEFLVDYATGSKTQIKTSLQSIRPLGMTPLAYAATQVIDHLRLSKTKATIILVTDGIESCKGNLCEVVKAAKIEGIDFRLHIIGFGLTADETDALKCAAQAGEGHYYDAADAEDLGEVLNAATTSTIDVPKGNVSVYTVMNGIAIDAWIKARDKTGVRKPLSIRTYQDTAYLYLPPGMYDIDAIPLEGSDVEMVTIPDVQSFEDKAVHHTISFDAGTVSVITTNNGTYWDCMVKLINQDGKVAASMRTYQNPKTMEVNPGVYTMTIQALAMEGIHTYTEKENVKVTAGVTYAVSHDFETGKAFIDGRADGKSIDCVVTVTEASSNKNVASGRTYDRGKEFLLNPGVYNVKLTPLGEYKNRTSQIISIEVKKGEMTSETIAF